MPLAPIKLLIKKKKSNQQQTKETIPYSPLEPIAPVDLTACLHQFAYLYDPSIACCSFIGLQLAFIYVAHTSVALALSNTDVGICILLFTSLLRYSEQDPILRKSNS